MFEFVPKLLPAGSHWCIAGGYAACPALADDIDVFVFYRGVSADILQERRRDLIRHLALNDWEFTTEQDSIQGDYEHEACVINKVARVTRRPCDKDIHVVVTNALTIDKLIDHFDVSTHQVAIDQMGSVWKAPTWTPPHVPPVAVLDNSNTLDRMQRIALRFGHIKEA